MSMEYLKGPIILHDLLLASLSVFALILILVGVKGILCYFDPDHWAGPKEMVICIAILLVGVGLGLTAAYFMRLCMQQ